jgi:ABC-type lipoprotein export system ATPase subunit
MNCLHFDRRSTEIIPMNIESQLLKGIEIAELYNFIFSADYLKPVYNLKLGDKSLKELSPGERGALLLIFYLVLDKNDIPLLIDQPEENLDNESVYNILVHFIKRVKEQRQIIIVTHNPNIAVVCDADQIINMRIEKDNRNAVKYSSGAIEDEVINKAIIDILEGTLPAFDNRDSKYLR